MKRKHTIRVVAASAAALGMSLLGIGGASASSLFDGAIAVAIPGFWPNPHMTNLAVESGWNQATITNNALAESLRGCTDCTALAASIEVALISNVHGPVNANTTAKVIDKSTGGSNQNLAVAATFIVAASNRVHLSDSGWDQIQQLSDQVRALRLQGSNDVAVLAQINSLLSQVQNVLQANIETSGPALSTPNTNSPATPNLAPALTPNTAPAPASGVQITSDIKVAN